MSDSKFLAQQNSHMRGSKAIAEFFGVSVRTVCAWKKRGAPILIFGRQYQANYGELWNWLKANISVV